MRSIKFLIFICIVCFFVVLFGRHLSVFYKNAPSSRKTVLVKVSNLNKISNKSCEIYSKKFLIYKHSVKDQYSFCVGAPPVSACLYLQKQNVVHVRSNESESCDKIQMDTRCFVIDDKDLTCKEIYLTNAK